MINDFNAFRADARINSETFAFWDTFVEMVSILKDLVRADREGNWQLHLQIIQSALPIFAGCDRTNYYRWAAVYLEDMRRLQKDASDVHENFARNPYDKDFNLVEEFLVQVYPMKSPSGCKTMDQLRYHVFHHSSNTILDLPPTSRLIRGHIQRAVYGSYMQTHCLDNPHLDPKDFGFFEQDDLLRPVQDQILLPDEFPMPCTCTSCATKRCSCGKRGIRCCPYCQCQASGMGCKNVR